MLVNMSFKLEKMFTRERLAKKAASLKIIEYSLLDKELKAQTDIAKKQYQGLNKLFVSDEKEEPVTVKKYNKSDLIYNSKYIFYKYYRYVKKFDNLSFKSKYSFLFEFFNDLNKFNNLKTQKENAKKEKNKLVSYRLRIIYFFSRNLF